MVDTKDSKSFGGNSVTVQVRSPALSKNNPQFLGIVFILRTDREGSGGSFPWREY